MTGAVPPLWRSPFSCERGSFMSELFENTELRPRAVLVAVDTGAFDAEVSLEELEELAATNDIETVATVVQKRDELDRATALGAGKLAELAEFVKNYEANLVIFDHELSATQLRNVEKECGVEILDRTMLILEIFAARANSHEGRLQVELARNKYMLPRLSGLGVELSRLGGGGGGAGAGARRGKGETKLELDRRHIRRRIKSLEEQLESLESRRELTRRRRRKDGVTSVAIVGYTNVGKSTLLNTLTDAGVLVQDKLFATLDPTARSLELPDGRGILLIDTVGLVRRLPHHLVQAFKSTLEEAVQADLLLNVCDISAPDAQDQVEVTRALLEELGARQVPVLEVLNKADRLQGAPPHVGKNAVLLSAKDGTGLEELLGKITAMLPPSQSRLTLLVPYDEGGLLAEIRREGKILSEDYDEGGTLVDALVDHKLLHKVHAFIQ